MSGFRKIRKTASDGIQSGGIHQDADRRIVYDLDYDDAHEWHQTAHMSDCWCSDKDRRGFLDALSANVLGPAGFISAGYVDALDHDSMVVSHGPGFDSRDETPLRDAISGR